MGTCGAETGRGIWASGATGPGALLHALAKHGMLRACFRHGLVANCAPRGREWSIRMCLGRFTWVKSCNGCALVSPSQVRCSCEKGQQPKLPGRRHRGRHRLRACYPMTRSKAHCILAFRGLRMIVQTADRREEWRHDLDIGRTAANEAFLLRVSPPVTAWFERICSRG